MSRWTSPAGLPFLAPLTALVERITGGGLTSGTFARSVLVLTAGGAAGQAIAVIASPIITRLYQPADLGTLSVYTSILSLIGVAVSLRFEQAIPMPAEDKDGRHLLAVALTVTVNVGLITALVVLLFGNGIADLTNTPGLMPWLWLLPLSVMAMGAFESLSLWAVRIREFGSIARGKLVQNIAQMVAQISFGLMGLGPAGLIIGDSGSRFFAGGVLSRMLSRKQALLEGVSWSGMRAATRQYGRFAVVASASGVVNSAVGNLPPILYFALGRLVIFAPFGLLGNSIARVYMSRITRARHEDPGSLMGLLIRVTLRLALSLPIFIGLFILAPIVFPIIFGSEWAEVGVYTQILCPALALDFILQTTQVLLPLRFVGQLLAWDIYRMVTALGGMLLAHAAGAEAPAAIAVYSLALCVSYVILFLLSVIVIRRNFPAHAASSTAA